MTPDCEQIRDLLPAYSIGATDADETRLVEAGLAACPELAADWRDYQQVAGMLAGPAFVPQSAPPPELLTRILEETRQQRVISMPRRAAIRRWWWLAASVAAFILLNNALWLAWANTRPTEDNFTEAWSLDLPTAANGESTAASAKVLWSPQSEWAVLVADNFPSLSPDQIYQVWLTRENRIASLGTFQVDETGQGTLTFPARVLQTEFIALGVTPEPGAGSPQPTAPPVVRWERKERN